MVNKAALGTDECAVGKNFNNLCGVVNCGIVADKCLCLVAYKKNVTDAGCIIRTVLFGILINLIFNNVIIVVVKEIGICRRGSLDVVVSKK